MTKIKNESPILCTLCRLSSEVAKSLKYSLWEAFFFVSFSKMCVFLTVRGLYRCACAFSSCSAWASYCGGSSGCRAQTLGECAQSRQLPSSGVLAPSL